MSEKPQTYTTQIDGWPFRIQEPAAELQQPRVLLLLHGHLGNENVMWVLTHPLPKGYTMLAPRAPLKLGENQYSWHAIEPQWPDMDHYQDLTEGLLARVDSWADQNAPGVSMYDVMGFSQGGVLAYALAILHPDRVDRVAAIASFIPQTWKQSLDKNTLKNKRFFIAHGTEDEIIPVKKAREASEWLKEKGADVTFCTADTGHKISSNCFNGLGEFFQHEPASPAADQRNHA